MERTVRGSDKSIPTSFNPAMIPEAVKVKARPTRNCVKILLCFPNIRLEITEDNRNIQAKAQIKTTTEMLDPSKDESEGDERLRDDATVVVAV